MDEKQKNLFGERDAVLAALAAEEKIIDDEIINAHKRVQKAEEEIELGRARQKSLNRAVIMISNLVPDGEKKSGWKMELMPITIPPEEKEPLTVTLSSGKRKVTISAPKKKEAEIIPLIGRGLEK